MVEASAVYACEICGNVVSVVEAHEPIPVCCGRPMTLLQPKTSEQEGREKHVPVIDVEGNRVTVRVGSVPHPMEAEHFIELIQLLKNGKIIAEARLYPDREPKATFFVEGAEGMEARGYCTVHGLWKS